MKKWAQICWCRIVITTYDYAVITNNYPVTKSKIYFFLISPQDMLIDSRERREGEKHWCEREISIMRPNGGWTDNPGMCSIRIKPVTFQFMRWCSTQWSHTIQGQKLLLTFLGLSGVFDMVDLSLFAILSSLGFLFTTFWWFPFHTSNHRFSISIMKFSFLDCH